MPSLTEHLELNIMSDLPAMQQPTLPLPSMTRRRRWTPSRVPRPNKPSSRIPRKELLMDTPNLISQWKPYGRQRLASSPEISTTWPHGPPSIKRVDTENAACDIFATRKSAVKKWIKENTDDCQAIELFCLSKDSRSPYFHTMTITVRSNEHTAQNKFERDFPWFDMPVVFLRGRITRSSLVGAGVGVKGVDWTRGSIGGLVKLNGGYYLTTCRHVTHPVRLRVEYTGDLENPPLMERIGRCEVRRSIVGACLAMREKYRRCNERNCEEGIRDAERNLQEAEDAVASRLQYLLGKVASTEPISKATIRGKRREVDWSLIQVTPAALSRLGDVNGVPVESSLNLEFEDAETVNVVGSGSMSSSLKALTGDNWVFKRGDQTGVTEGFLDNDWHELDITCSKDPRNFTAEYAVLPQLPGSEPFSMAGDSGSWVIDSSRRVVGFVWASSEERPYRSYVTSIDDWIARVKKVTGYEPEVVTSSVSTNTFSPRKKVMSMASDEGIVVSGDEDKDGWTDVIVP